MIAGLLKPAKTGVYLTALFLKWTSGWLFFFESSELTPLSKCVVLKEDALFLSTVEELSRSFIFVSAFVPSPI